MEVRDLRLGNLVQVGEAKMEVRAIEDRAYIRLYSFLKNTAYLYPVDSVSPIPITEEWLGRFGFTFNKPLSEYVYNHFNIYRIDKDEFDLECNDSVITTIKHVHQLQNVIYSLTGEELEVAKSDVKKTCKCPPNPLSDRSDIEYARNECGKCGKKIS